MDNDAAAAKVPVERGVALGRKRWDIENHGFNELVDGWHADRVFKHDDAAIENFRWQPAFLLA